MNTQKEAHQRIHTSWEEGAGPKELVSGRRQAGQPRGSEHRAAPKHWSMSPLGVCAQVSQNSGSKSRVPSLPHGGRSVTKSCPTLATPWTVAHQAPLSMGFFQPRILEWVAIPFSRGSSQSTDQTQVFCITGRFFTD